MNSVYFAILTKLKAHHPSTMDLLVKFKYCSGISLEEFPQHSWYIGVLQIQKKKCKISIRHCRFIFVLLDPEIRVFYNSKQGERNFFLLTPILFYKILQQRYTTFYSNTKKRFATFLKMIFKGTIIIKLLLLFCCFISFYFLFRFFFLL